MSNDRTAEAHSSPRINSACKSKSPHSHTYILTHASLSHLKTPLLLASVPSNLFEASTLQKNDEPPRQKARYFPRRRSRQRHRSSNYKWHNSQTQRMYSLLHFPYMTSFTKLLQSQTSCLQTSKLQIPPNSPTQAHPPRTQRAAPLFTAVMV